MTDEEIIERISIAANRVLGRSVSYVDREEWFSSIRSDGSVTELDQPPAPLRAVSTSVPVQTQTASGGVNQSPGVDIVRYDEADAPDVYNTDHYPAFEDLTVHPQYDRVLKIAGIDHSTETDDLVRRFVFLRGPIKRGGKLHRSADVPGYIAGAKKKDEDS